MTATKTKAENTGNQKLSTRGVIRSANPIQNRNSRKTRKKSNQYKNKSRKPTTKPNKAPHRKEQKPTVLIHLALSSQSSPFSSLLQRPIPPPPSITTRSKASRSLAPKYKFGTKPAYSSIFFLSLSLSHAHTEPHVHKSQPALLRYSV